MLVKNGFISFYLEDFINLDYVDLDRGNIIKGLIKLLPNKRTTKALNRKSIGSAS